jgi:hypothetical protein
MGCFSFICPLCGKGINSSSFDGENVRLTLLDKGKVLEEMQGAYDSYGRVFGTEKDPRDKSCTETSSLEWKKEWGEVCDLMFEGSSNSGIAAAHLHCIKKTPGYKPTEKSDDDPDQGWNRIKSYHRGECEIYHKIMEDEKEKI